MLPKMGLMCSAQPVKIAWNLKLLTKLKQNDDKLRADDTENNNRSNEVRFIN